MAQLEGGLKILVRQNPNISFIFLPVLRLASWSEKAESVNVEISKVNSLVENHSASWGVGCTKSWENDFQAKHYKEEDSSGRHLSRSGSRLLSYRISELMEEQDNEQKRVKKSASKEPLPILLINPSSFILSGSVCQQCVTIKNASSSKIQIKVISMSKEEDIGIALHEGLVKAGAQFNMQFTLLNNPPKVPGSRTLILKAVRVSDNANVCDNDIFKSDGIFAQFTISIHIA